MAHFTKDDIERAFRAGFGAAQDYEIDFEQDRAGKGVRDLQRHPPEDEAWSRFAESSLK